jgi:hypothetical protein
MSNKFNGFSAQDMNPTQTNTEVPGLVEGPLSSQSIEGGIPSSSQAIDIKDLTPENIDIVPQATGTSSSQAIGENRSVPESPQIGSGQQVVVPEDSFASLQVSKLGGVEPSAGYGSPNLPFAG